MSDELKIGVENHAQIFELVRHADKLSSDIWRSFKASGAGEEVFFYTFKNDAFTFVDVKAHFPFLKLYGKGGQILV